MTGVVLGAGERRGGGVGAASGAIAAQCSRLSPWLAPMAGQTLRVPQDGPESPQGILKLIELLRASLTFTNIRKYQLMHW